MMDGNPDWEPPPGAPRRPGRLAVAAGAAAAVIALATVGAVGGWLLADADAPPVDVPDGALSQSASPARGTPDFRPTTTAPLATAQPTGTATSIRADDPVVVPDLVGEDFERARRELHELRLGWQLVFGTAGDDRAVESLDPPPGVTVRRGTTVKVYVTGVAPTATVPVVTGIACGRAKDLVVEHGLYPDYPTGQAGWVVRQEPEPPADLRWNDRMRLYCSTVRQTP